MDQIPFFQHLEMVRSQMTYTNIYTSWTQKEDKEISIPNHIEDDVEKLSENLHQMLDDLPGYGPHESLLDIFWLTDCVPSNRKMPLSLFGALKRSLEWHGASIFVLSAKLDGKTNPSFLKDLRAELMSSEESCLQEILDPGTIWRGSLAFFDDADMNFVCSGSQFELVESDSSEMEISKNEGNLQLQVLTNLW